MPDCPYCGRDRATAMSCSVKSIADAGISYPRAMVDRLDCVDGRCRDCGACEGNFHHLGCARETCPKCYGQLVSCGCFDQVLSDWEGPE